MGDLGSTLQLSGEKMVHLADFGSHGAETQTLNEVYKFCFMNPKSKVLYFHNKGSLNFNTMNTNFRRALDCFILNPQCIDALNNGFDTCGWRLSPLPHIHYSGNYWWATCKHINKLIPPLVHAYNDTFLALTAQLYSRDPHTTTLPSHDNPFPDQAYLGLGRYFAETWVGSAPMFQPADCMNASMNNRYMWGKAPLPWRLVNRRCPNFKPDFMGRTAAYSTETTATNHIVAANPLNHQWDSAHKKPLKYGLSCAIAGFIAQPYLVKKKFVMSSANFTKELYDRSMFWYGQPPQLHMSWFQLYD